MMRKYDLISLMILFLSTTLFLSAELIPLPLTVDTDDKKVQLGKKLFLDPILSKDNTLSCQSCHKLQDNGADKIPYTEGIHGEKGVFNTPTVYNAAYNFRQFWDGRAKNLKDQALKPISNPVEMGNTVEKAIHDLKADPVYLSMFNEIYNDGITEKNLAEVLAEFEKALITPNSSFDKYLRGDNEALTNQEKKGYHLFKTKGCISCHNGINIGGNLYNKFGIYQDAHSKELGRYNQTKKEEDKYVFKVPSLRNVAITAPYMHDGRFKSLDEIIDFYSEGLVYSDYVHPLMKNVRQEGVQLNDEDKAALKSFLLTLTDHELIHDQQFSCPQELKAWSGQ